MDLDDPKLPGGYFLIVSNKELQGKCIWKDPELSGGDFLIVSDKEL